MRRILFTRCVLSSEKNCSDSSMKLAILMSLVAALLGLASLGLGIALSRTAPVHMLLPYTSDIFASRFWGEIRAVDAPHGTFTLAVPHDIFAFPAIPPSLLSAQNTVFYLVHVDSSTAFSRNMFSLKDGAVDRYFLGVKLIRYAAGFGDLRAGMRVQVLGARDAQGDYVASNVFLIDFVTP